MSPAQPLSLAKLAAVFSLLACAGSVAWVVLQQGRVRQAGGAAVLPEFGGAPLESRPLAPLAMETPRWPQPPAQSQGGGWIYEVFTPPVIFYNAAARSFAVTAPQYANEALPTAFGLELLAVKREPFRLQLTGYFGGPGDYLGAFVSPGQPQTLLAREGRRFAELGLTLQSLDVRKVALQTEAPGPVWDIAAFAVLLDERTGAQVTLDNRAPLLTDTPLAVFQITGNQGRPREFREGDTFADEQASYRIERIQLEPPEVVVARTTPGLPVPEIRVLRPAAAVAAKGAPAKPAAGRPEQVAANGQ